MLRRNSLEPPAYDALYGPKPSDSALPPVYVREPDSNSSRSAISLTDSTRAPPQPDYRRHSHSHDSRRPADTGTNTTPQRQRPGPSSFAASYYEPQPATSPRRPASSSPPPAKPTSFRARYRAALAEDRERRKTRTQRISGTEAQRITGNAARRREENIQMGRRASFGDEDFSRDVGDDENYLSPEGLERKRAREKERQKSGAGTLLFLAF